MANTKQAIEQGEASERELAELIQNASAGPGVLDLMRIYERAERAYSAATPEPAFFVAASTSAR